MNKRLFLISLLVSLIILPIIFLAFFNLINSYQTSSQVIYSQKKGKAYFASLVLQNQFDRLLDLSASFTAGATFRELITKGKWEEAIAILSSIPQDFPSVDRIFLTDTQGILMTDTPALPEVRGKNFNFRDWYQGVSHNWKPYVSEIYERSAEPKMNVLAVATPIFSSKDTSVLGVLVLQIKIDNLFQWTATLPKETNEIIYFVDQKGNVAVHPKADPQKEIINYATLTPVANLIQGKSGVVVTFTPFEREEQIIAYQSSFGGNGWGAVVSQPTHDAFLLRDNNFKLNVVIYTIVSLVSFGLVILLLRIFSKLQKSKEAFKVANQKLEKYKSELEKRVEERVKELSLKTKNLEESKATTANLLENLYLEKEQIKEEEAKDEAILSSIGDGLIATDREGKIIFVNKAFENILGWKALEVQGKLLSQVVLMVDENGKKISESERLITEILNEHITTTTITTNYLRKDKTSFPVALTVSPIINNKNLIGAIAVFRDITKEKEIDKAKTEFVSLASHQLRTPLSAVNWYAEMLLAGDAGKLNKKEKKYLEEIYTGNQRMVELVNALLNVSRLELGTFIIEPEPIIIADLLQSVIDEQKLQIIKKKITLSSAFKTKIPPIQADKKLLRTVMQNLLSNAIKYTPEKGGIMLSLALDDKKNNILLKVADTGYGIPKNQQDKIFTKLFRADNVKEKDTNGIGLGLYIVKSIIEHSGGKVWFKSKENQGTTFYVTLPLDGMKEKEGAGVLS